MNDPKKRSWKTQALLTAIALALLALAVYKNRGKIQDVFARTPDYRLFAIAFFVYMAALLSTFYRWYLLARAVDFPFKIRDAFRLGFIGNVFNLVIPGAVGGDLIKVVFLCREQPGARTEAVASVVLDRLIGLLGLFLLGGIIGLTAWPGAGFEVRLMIGLAWLAVLGVSTLLAIAFTPGLYQPLIRLASNRQKLKSILEKLVEVASVYRTKLKVVAATIAMAMGNHSLNVIVFYLVGLSLFGSIPSFASHFVIVPLALFSTAVPLPFGALGLSEQISDRLFDVVGHPSGAVAMMGFRVIMYAAGLVSLVIYLINIQRVRDLSTAAASEAADAIEPAAEAANPLAGEPA